MRRFGLMVLGGLAGLSCGGGGDGGSGPPTITSVVISGDSTVVLAGHRQLSATAMSGNTPVTTGVTFIWSSWDTTHATVSASGVVTGLALGQANIMAAAVVNGSFTNVIGDHLMRTRIGSIVFTPAAPSFASLSDTLIVTAEARDALNTAVPGVTFTWQSRVPAVATAADSGTRKAIVVSVANGTTMLVATGDGVSDSATVHVQQSP